MFTTAQVATDLQNDQIRQRQFFGVVTVPDGQVIPTVDLPQTGAVTPPMIGSTVLVWVTGSNGAKYICTLIDPNNSFSRLNTLIDGKPAMEPGELQIAAAAGGATILLNSVGGIHLNAGTLKDEVVIDNQTVKVAASVIDIHANSTVPGIRAHLSMDSLGSIHLGKQTPLFPVATNLSGFSVGTLGDVSMSTGPELLPLGSVNISPLGTATLESGPGSGTLAGGLGQITANPLGIVTLTNKLKSTMILDELGGVSLAAQTTINIGSFLGVFSELTRRLVDERFMELFAGHTHTSTTPGNPTSPVVFPIVGIPIPNPQLELAMTLHTKAD